MPEELGEDKINERLENLEVWGVMGGKLVTEIEFDDYRESVFFANTVFSIAEELFHHPVVEVEYGSVKIDVWTHEVEGLTEKDFEFAETVEEKIRSIQWG